MNNNKRKWYIISKALRETNGSPFALEIIHNLYDAGLLNVKEPTRFQNKGGDV